MERQIQFQTHTDDRLAHIETSLVDIQTTINILHLKQVSSAPVDPKNISEVVSILETAKQKNVPIPDNAIQQAGDSFLGAGRLEPKAWDAALGLVSYRTISNRKLLAVGTASQIATTPVTEVATSYKIEFLEGHAIPRASVGGDVPIAVAADIHPLNEDSSNRGSRGKEVILFEGGTISLDNMLFKNVVLRNVEVIYNGGPVKLEKVIFVNCTFRLTRGRQTQTLAEAVLSDSTITFAGV